MLTKTSRDKLICRIRDHAGFDIVIVETIHVSDPAGTDHGLFTSHLFRVQSTALRAECSGTFWELDLDEEKKPASERSLIDQSVLLSRPNEAKSFLSSVSLPRATLPLAEAGPLRTVRNLAKLNVAILSDAPPENLATILRLQGISAPSDIQADFLGIGHDLFVRREALTLESGRFFAPVHQAARFPAFALSGRHHDIILSGKRLRLFLEDPVVQSRPVDIRTKEEKDQALRELFARSAFSAQITKNDREILMKAAELVSSLASGTLDADELQIARATISGIVDRTPVIEAIPRLLRDDPSFTEDIRASMESARREALQKVEEEFVAPRREAEAELAETRLALADAERDLSLISERSRAYADATTSAKAEIKADIKEAVIAYLDEGKMKFAKPISSLQADGTNFDVDMIVDRLLDSPESVERIATVLASENVEAKNTERQSRPCASTLAARADSLRMWADDAHVRYTDLVTAFALSMTWRIPSFFGPDRDAAAEVVCNAVGGGEYYVVHCDPTMISLADLVGREGDFFTPLRDAIEEATGNADVLVPVLFRNINYAPCQFWLQALADREDGYPLPRNLLVLSTLAQDSSRVAVPESLWDYLIPLAATRLSDDATSSPLPDTEAYKSMPWARGRADTGPVSDGLVGVALGASKKASGKAPDAAIAKDAHSLLMTAAAYLDLDPDDIKLGFEVALCWKRREEQSEDELIAKAIDILKG